MPITIIPEQYKTTDDLVFKDRIEAEQHQAAIDGVGDLAVFFRETGIGQNQRKKSEYERVIIAYATWSANNAEV